VATEVVRQIRSAQPGGVLQVSTRGMTLRHVHRALMAAVEEGVRVHYVTRSRRLTDREATLADALQSARSGSFGACVGDCAAAWKTDQMPSVVLVSDAGGTPTSVVGATRRLRDSLITSSARAVVSTSSARLADAVAAFARR